MVARDEDLCRGLVEADVPVVVTRGGYYLEAVVAVVVHVSVAQVEQIGLVFHWQQLRRNAVGGSIALLHAALVVGVGAGKVADKRVEHTSLHVHKVLHFLDGVHVGVHAHPTAPYSVEVAGVVGVRMSEHDLHRFPAAAQLAQSVVQRLLAGGVVEAHVYDGGFVFA